ncbi:hypothetical protein [Archangium lipolyticum]|uniref:hypothetical protein n=1 Tax=Archangium lipolyticum TaxID=2970465 RepID=UPI002149A23B|nr:hypothetical protein [Archangium lipolyticum]
MRSISARTLPRLPSARSSSPSSRAEKSAPLAVEHPPPVPPPPGCSGAGGNGVSPHTPRLSSIRTQAVPGQSLSTAQMLRHRSGSPDRLAQSVGPAQKVCSGVHSSPTAAAGSGRMRHAPSPAHSIVSGQSALVVQGREQ